MGRLPCTWQLHMEGSPALRLLFKMVRALAQCCLSHAWIQISLDLRVCCMPHMLHNMLFFFLEIALAFLMENIILSDLCGCRS